MKFEKNAEIKMMYKKADPSEYPERDAELAQVKIDMENHKNQKVGEAKARLKVLKDKLRDEKQQKLKELKSNMHNSRPKLGGSMVGESYDYMNDNSPTKGTSQTFICQTPTNTDLNSLDLMPSLNKNSNSGKK